MKIAIVHSFYASLIPSGENNVVLAQIDALRKIGHEVRLIAKYTDQLSESPTYKLRTALNIVAQRGASPLEELSEFQPDVVHVHNLFPNYSRGWVHSWDGPLVVTIHNFRPVCAAGTLFRDGNPCSECVDLGSHRSVVNRCYRGSALASIPLAFQTRGGINGDPVLRRADRIILLAQRAYDTYRSFGLEEQKMDLLPNFVDQAEFKPNEGPGSHWTYIGRLTAEKGIMNLLGSWPQGHHLRIIGDGPLRTEVEAATSRLANVQFEGGVARSEIAEILANSRGLVFSSEWPEGAPLVYVEALASGRPVIARTGNSVADDVARYRTGLVYSDPTQLKSGIEEIFRNWNAFHSQALERFHETYSADAWARKVEDIYCNARERPKHN